MSRRKNKFVSTSAVTRLEKEEISKLVITPKFSGHGNYKSVAWKYFGELSTTVTAVDVRDNVNDDLHDPVPGSSTSKGTCALRTKVTVLDAADRYYCRLCLEKEQAKYAKGDSTAHLSKVKNFSKKTATSSFCDHLCIEHGINPNYVVQNRNNAQMSSLKQSTLDSKLHSTDGLQPASSSYELNRDMALWFALDLEPFEKVEKVGFNYFFRKNFPNMKLPTEATIRGTALRDVYHLVKNKVVEDMKDAPAICLMFDGWTDQHKAKGYLGLRSSYITKDWDLRLVTLSCKPLQSHTGESIANHVREELTEFIDLKAVQLFSTHDGAANMLKSSRLLRVQGTTHCSAHALNSLLMTDGISRVEDIMSVIEKCKTVTRTQHCKGHMIEEDLAVTHDRKVIDQLMSQISMVHDVTSLDDQFPADEPGQATNHGHTTLKKHVITRWNSVLTMVESLLDLKDSVQESLKRTGNVDLLLGADEWELLGELRQFLKVFKDLTELVSSGNAGLSLIPLINDEVKEAVKPVSSDSPSLVELKRHICKNIDWRFPLTQFVQLCSLLDPSTKDTLNLGNEEKQQILRDALTELENSPVTLSVQNDNLAEAAQLELQHSSKKRKLIEKMKKESSESDNSIVNDEITRYFVSKPTLAQVDNPLVFWKANQHIFPLLSKLARRYLCISASSVPVPSLV